MNARSARWLLALGASALASRDGLPRLTIVHIVYLLAFALGGWALTVRLATKRLNK